MICFRCGKNTDILYRVPTKPNGFNYYLCEKCYNKLKKWENENNI